MIELVNRERKANGLPPLKQVASLTAAARLYAKDMVDDDYFGPGHDTYDRVGGQLVKSCAWSARIGAFYAGGALVAENIGQGYSSPEEVVTGWMGSSGHRANILNGSHWETVSGTGRPVGGTPLGTGLRPPAGDLPRRDQRRGGEHRQPSRQPLRLRQLGRGPHPERRRGIRPWQPFSSTVSWSLADVEGLRTVSLEMRRGSTVVAASDTIELSPR